MLDILSVEDALVPLSWLGLAMKRFISMLAVLACLGAAHAQPPADEAAADELLLKSVKVATDGPGLLAFFRKRLVSDADQQRVALLVKQLGDNSFPAREKATADLTAIGPPALPALRRALNDEDAEVVRRAKECITAIDKAGGPEVEAAALRLLKLRRPEGALAVLLDYAPAVTDPAAEEELLSGLLVIGVKEGKTDSELVKALKDRRPALRAAAALVLGRSGTPEQREAVRPLLADAEPKVRLRAAQGLIAGKDKSGLPALLPLLSDAPPEVARQAEDMLGWVAGDKGPKVPLGEGDAARKRCRAAWEGWWKANEDKLDLAKANADLPWLHPSQRARAAAVEFVNAMLKPDPAAVKRLTDCPFCLMGVQTFQTREELDKFVGDTLVRGPRPKATFKTGKVLSGDEYLKQADGPFKDFVAGLPRGEVRAVFLDVEVAGEKQTQRMAIVVRLGGGRARVVGIGEVRAESK